MKYLKNVKFLTIMIAVFSLIIIIFPISIRAALMQNASLNNQIKVNSINSKWVDGNNSSAESLTIPEFVAPGEEINLNGGLYIQNLGNDSYARFKVESKLNGIEENVVEIQVSQGWVLGSDGWYYYVSAENTSVLLMHNVVKAIEKIIVVDSLNNSNIGNLIEIGLTSEVADINENKWEEWNPPNEWYN